MFSCLKLLVFIITVATIVEITVASRCRGGFDLYFVLDKSSSVRRDNFRDQTVSFVEKIVSSFVSSKLRVSFITFSTHAKLIMGLTSNRTKIQKGLDALRVVTPGGDTYMDLGIKMANDQIKRLGEKTAGVIITLTDGQIARHAKQTFAQAKESRLYGASVYAVGVDRYNKDELIKIADKPSKDHVFVADNYNALQNIIDSIITKSCIEVISAEPKSTCAGEPFTATLHGNGFTKTDNISRVRCNFKLGDKDMISKASYVTDTEIKCEAPKLPYPARVNLHVSVNSVKYVSSDVFIETKDCSPRVESVKKTTLCAGESTVIPVSGEYLLRSSNKSYKNVACSISYNNTFTGPGKVISLTQSAMKCEIPAFIEIGRTIYLHITSSDYENVLKTITFKVASCTPVKKHVNVGLIIGVLFILLLFGLLLVWWFWLLIFPKPRQEPVSPTSATGPPQKKWPSVDTSYYGGGGIGGITPVKVKWGDKGVTDAGALLAADKKSKKTKDTSTSSEESEPTPPSCWDISKERIVAFFMLFPKAYTWLASHRPQRKGESGAEYRQVRQV